MKQKQTPFGVAMQFPESQFYPKAIVNFKFHLGIPIWIIILSQYWTWVTILSNSGQNLFCKRVNDRGMIPGSKVLVFILSYP